MNAVAADLGAGDDLPAAASAVRTDRGGDASWWLADEVPVALAFNGRSRAVMLATPRDLEDFALGFALTEQIIPSPNAVRAIHVVAVEEGIWVDMTVPRSLLASERLRRRRIAGRSGCGLCGIETLEAAVRMPDTAPVRRHPPNSAAIRRGFAALGDHQPLNRLTRSVHAAVWCDSQGDIRSVREDVGRHNALDKLIGAASGRLDAPGFVLMSSRLSIELVQKSAWAGVTDLAAVSAPTALALRMARRAGIRLYALGDDGDVLTFPE